MNADTWYRAYCRWYDHRAAGHRIRADVWGRIADLMVAAGDRFGWTVGKR